MMKLAPLLQVAAMFFLSGCSGPSANTVRLAQERQACAEMGIDPGSQAFGQCVGNLDASMFEASNTAAR